MSFVSLEFLIFLFVVVFIFYLIPTRYKKYWLLLSSYYFYTSLDARLLLYLLTITMVNFIGGRLIEKSRRNRKVYICFWSIDILCLVFFKYVYCFEEILKWGLQKTNIFLDISFPEILIPAGISFIIFQTTTYLGDIYKGKIKSQKFAQCALFIAFFPTILSGPINKAHDLIPQFDLKKEVEKRTFLQGLFLILIGLFEKLIIADFLSGIVDTVFNDYTNYQGGHYIIAAVGYAFQIYADFSGYSDIARGCALLFGIVVKDNFNRPYLSQTLSEFWKKWHMSLNAWFVEYVYIPLGGGRKGKARKYVNTLIVFLFSGFWHGASLNFAIWGLINGGMQIFGQITEKFRKKIWAHLGITQCSIKIWLNRVIVFILITLTWIYFRAPSITIANYMIMQIGKAGLLQLFQKDTWKLLGSIKAGIVLILYLMGYTIVSISGKEKGKIFATYLEKPKILKVCILAFCLAILVVLLCENYTNPDRAFIYFQF